MLCRASRKTNNGFKSFDIVVMRLFSLIVILIAQAHDLKLCISFIKYYDYTLLLQFSVNVSRNHTYLKCSYIRI